ncbi:DNL zinc finger-domain-containing protein [Entophlyctis helioformis]|nr:DNL zinc finger-domain-containing protein [Entophlyctis helioformis]
MASTRSYPPSAVAVAATRSYTSPSMPWLNASSSAPKPPSQASLPSDPEHPSESTLAGLDTSADRMIIGFTCKVCDLRSYKSMSKQAYASGVVIIKCDGCKNLHLIADHLGWFEHGKPAGTIEDILRDKGESVRRVQWQQPLRFKSPDASATASARSGAAETAAGGSAIVEVQDEPAVNAEGMLEWLPRTPGDANKTDPSSGKQ